MVETFGVATKAVIIFNDKVLLMDKSDTEDVNPNTVDIPGGRLEFRENPEDGLKREVMEEAGLAIDVIKPTRTWTFVKEDKGLQIVGISFLCRLADESKEPQVKLSGEHVNSYWIQTEAVLSGAYPDWIKAELKAALAAK